MIRYIFVVFILCSGTHSGQFPNRIFHGKQVDNNIQYKFTVEIKMLGDHFCGGSLISLKNVLTAAHCFVKLKEHGLDSFKVYAGIVDNTDNTNQRSIANLWIHKDWRKPDNFSNDIALLDLDVPFDRDTRGTQIIQIAPQKFAWPAGDEGTVFGWGLMQNNTLARYLMHTNITLINKIQCKQLLMARGLEEQFDDRMECSLDPDGAKDACSADSGGPMVHFKTGYLIGIVSWGIGCGVKWNPGVYMSVAYYHDWIKEHTGVE